MIGCQLGDVMLGNDGTISSAAHEPYKQVWWHASEREQLHLYRTALLRPGLPGLLLPALVRLRLLYQLLESLVVPCCCAGHGRTAGCTPSWIIL